MPKLFAGTQESLGDHVFPRIMTEFLWEVWEISTTSSDIVAPLQTHFVGEVFFLGRQTWEMGFGWLCFIDLVQILFKVLMVSSYCFAVALPHVPGFDSVCSEQVGHFPLLFPFLPYQLSLGIVSLPVPVPSEYLKCLCTGLCCWAACQPSHIPPAPPVREQHQDRGAPEKWAQKTGPSRHSHRQRKVNIANHVYLCFERLQ